MTYSYQLKDLDLLIRQYFGDEVKLVHYEAKPLTSKGENYGSEILDLEVQLQHNSSVRTLKMVAKMCPPNDMLKEMFDTTMTFKKEIIAYNTILPMLLKFQEENCEKSCEKIYAECYASRFSLNPKLEVIDDDAIILLENLRSSQYDVGNRMKGFNLDQTELVLEALSTFHAVPIAFKMKNPEIFLSQILPHLTRNTIFDTVDTKTENVDIDLILQAANTNDQCRMHVDKIDKAMRIGLKNHSEIIAREPFATILHNDYWVNNVLLKSDERKCKIVDFQLIDYGSSVNDLIFFLFTSVQEDVLNAHFNYLLKFYYDALLRNLKELNCDTKQFTFETYMEEIDFCASTKQFYHIMGMLRIIFAGKENMKGIREVTMDDFLSNDDISPECTQRIITTILHFAKYNWI